MLKKYGSIEGIIRQLYALEDGSYIEVAPPKKRGRKPKKAPAPVDVGVQTPPEWN